MRYVKLAVVIGLLVVVPVGSGFYSVKAAEAAKAGDVRVKIVQNLPNVAPPSMEEIYSARTQYVALKEEERRRQEEERLRREAEEKRQNQIVQLGPWGPDLVGAAEQYGQNPFDLYRVMMCESTGNPYADNGVNKGLFQFHPGTWAGTPYGSTSIYNGSAQIYGAAWMWSQGRKGEWVCR